ncbi:6-phosphofructokinase [Coxiella-like endosymbiont of Rhipicephalus sanguineus]|uniref:6-phosphofructokinase n=1 Tax=Coxiella-like endosymbiont of Rhipicephalus sanguineus TaxID=1955402 RepID=UPI0020424C5B|nr:6-phosphofructokinase [Coxiella-like endosymbiont of Rhipicephalus sanguineus]
MGRPCVTLHVNVNIAGGSEIIVISEFPIEVNTLAQKIKNQQGKNQHLFVVAEAHAPSHSFKVIVLSSLNELRKKLISIIEFVS